MAQQLLTVGAVANDGTGGQLRTEMVKVNSNFTELYNGLGGIFAKTGTAASITGTLTETALATVNIPASTVGANGEIKVRTFWTVTNSANNKVLRVRLGGIAGSICGGLTPTTIAGLEMTVYIRNKNSASSQYLITIGARGTDGLVTNVISTPTTVDTSASQDLVISGQLANTGETITLEGYAVEIIK